MTNPSSEPAATSNDPRYELQTADTHAVVALRPGINEAQWSDIESLGGELLKTLESQHSPILIVDLSALDYMGSSIVALIVRMWKMIKERGGKLVVVNRHPVVREVLQIAGLEKIWPIVDSREEALKRLGIATSRAPRAAGGSSSGTWLCLLALLLGIGAAAGLTALFVPDLGLERKPALFVAFGCAALGLISGTVTAVRERGARRFVGVLVLVDCLAVIGVGLFRFGQSV